MSKKHNNKIDIIIPAFKAHNTILRTLSSIAAQSVIDDIEVTIVNDDPDPNATTYEDFVKMYSPFFPIREIKMDKNGGPGLARQKGIDETNNEFFTCIDADDTFAGALALEILREGMKDEIYKCVSGTFFQLGEDLQHIMPHQNDMVWMFGKLYRRKFIEDYKIRFNDTRANEDTGFNTMIRLLCQNPNEQIHFLQEVVYYWHNKEDSITRINDGQYALDQCFCGWTDNMIYAIKHVRSKRPFDGGVMQWSVHVLMELYFYYIETYARKRMFAKQNWEYVKKYYHACYEKYEDDITEEVLSQMYSMASIGKHQSGSLLGIIPHIGIKEFLEKLKTETYNPDDIWDVWEEMSKDENTLKLMHNNEECGVCPVGYYKRPIELKAVEENYESEDDE